MEFYAADREKELLPFVTAWMELESIMPGSEREIPYDLTYKWNQINKRNMQAKCDQKHLIKNKLIVNTGERGE